MASCLGCFLGGEGVEWGKVEVSVLTWIISSVMYYSETIGLIVSKLFLF